MRLRGIKRAILALMPVVAFANERLPMIYQPPAPPKALPNVPQAPAAAAGPTGNGCSVNLRKIEDARRNKETVGSSLFILEGSPTGVPLFGASVFSGDGLKWLRGGVETLPSMGVAFKEGVGRELDLQLRLAHAWVPGMNMTAHVVLEARLPLVSGHALKRYHGFGTKLNWNSGNAEFMETLNLAMHDALTTLAQDLQAICAGRKPTGLFAEGSGAITSESVPLTPARAAESIAPASAGPASSEPEATQVKAQPADRPVNAKSSPSAVDAVRSTIVYKITDRATRKSQTVSLRGDAGDQFLLGELGMATPPGGWDTKGLPRSVKFTTSGPGPHRQYTLDLQPGAQELVMVAGRQLRTHTVKAEGWLEMDSGQVPMRARYSARAWYSPEFQRVVRFEARSRAAGNSGAGYFEVDEQLELVLAD